MIELLARIILRHRLWTLIIFLAVSAVFAYGMGKVGFFTSFADLLPPKHPYIKAYNEYKKTFGGANIIAISIEKTKGDIYNVETLTKIKTISEFFETTPGVNQYQILSLCRPKVKEVKSTSWGLESNPVMWPDIPQTEKEIKALRDTIYSLSSVYGSLVSLDDKAAMITAELFEGRIDYDKLFKKIQPFLDSLSDEDTKIWYTGPPILHGWLYHHMTAVLWLFAITLGAMVLVLLFFTRTLTGVVVPLLSTFFSALWGIGFAGFVGFHFDPLMLVIPFLISARTISHSIQLLSRWIEEFRLAGDAKIAAERAFCGIFRPGIVSILTDAGGVLIIACAPIPILTNIAWMGSFWILSNIFTVFILNTLVLSFLNGYKLKNKERTRLEAFLFGAGNLYVGRVARWALLVPFVVLAVWTAIWVPKLTIGDARPGSPLLWEDSHYNQSAAHISEKFRGSDQLMVYIIGEERNTLKISDNLRKMDLLSRELMKLEQVGGAVSITSLVRTINSVFHYDHPFWRFVPRDRLKLADLYELAMAQGEPGDFDRWIDYDKRIGNVLLFLKDHTGETIKICIDKIKAFINENPLENAVYVLAGGYVGTIAAANDVIAWSHEVNLLAVLSFTFLCCSFAYRSFVAGFLFVLSLVLANFFTLSVMAFRGVGLNINTIPVISIGIGLGVDYGLYVVSRIADAHKTYNNLREAVAVGVSTSGRAVLITAITMIAGVILWYFSPIKFQAEMSLLLTIVLTMNLFGGMVLLPVLIFLIKPRFIVGRKEENK